MLGERGANVTNGDLARISFRWLIVLVQQGWQQGGFGVLHYDVAMTHRVSHDSHLWVIGLLWLVVVLHDARLWSYDVWLSHMTHSYESWVSRMWPLGPHDVLSSYDWFRYVAQLTLRSQLMDFILWLIMSHRGRDPEVWVTGLGCEKDSI